MTDSKPLLAVEAAEIVEANLVGQITALDATETAIARMEATNPAFNAVVESLRMKHGAEASALDSSDSRSAR